MLAILVIMGVAAASPQTGNPRDVVRARLDAMDRAFVCPERIASASAKINELGRFDAQLANAAGRPVTADEIGTFRMMMLQKHNCRLTLAKIASHEAYR